MASPHRARVHSDDTSIAYQDDPCTAACEQLMTEDICIWQFPDCAPPPPIRLATGATWTETWTGVALDYTQLPADCAAAQECAAGCAVARQAAADLYDARIQLYTTCDGDCACLDPTDESSLVTSGILGDPVSVEQSFSYPAQTSISLTWAPPP